MIDWYKKVVFENYANFNGRARRSEYWWFILANAIILVIAIIIDNILHLTIKNTPYGAFYIIYGIATFIPSLAVAVRRLHDVGKSGWFYFIILIPIIGGIWLLILFFSEGDKGTNKYGSDPKSNHDELNEIGIKE